MRVCGISILLLSLTSCETLFEPSPPVKPEIVVQTECSWVKSLTISDKTFELLSQNISDPEVRRDVDQIVAHNESYRTFCGS